MKKYTKLEKAVMNWMAEMLSIPNLKKQIQAATVINREYTGVGYFIAISVPTNLPAIHYSSFISGPIIEATGIDCNGGAILILDHDGYLTQLELYANGDFFAEDIDSFNLKQ